VRNSGFTAERAERGEVNDLLCELCGEPLEVPFKLSTQARSKYDQKTCLDIREPPVQS